MSISKLYYSIYFLPNILSIVHIHVSCHFCKFYINIANIFMVLCLNEIFVQLKVVQYFGYFLNTEHVQYLRK